MEILWGGPNKGAIGTVRGRMIGSLYHGGYNGERTRAMSGGSDKKDDESEAPKPAHDPPADQAQPGAEAGQGNPQEDAEPGPGAADGGGDDDQATAPCATPPPSTANGRFRRAILFIPAALSIGGAIGAALGLSFLYEQAPWLVPTVIALAVVLAALGLIAFYTEIIAPLPALLWLLLHAGALILWFAGIYDAYGLSQNGAPVAIDIWTGLYFSIVTWTTLGYGDFAPAESLRLVAATEAILGLLFFGILIGVVANLVNRRIERS
jgi:hypothetical protein